jgi:hypothetical protein
MVFWWNYAKNEGIDETKGIKETEGTEGTEEIKCRLKRNKQVNAS